VPELDGATNRPVRSDAILPVIGSQAAKMALDRMLVSNGGNGGGSESGCSGGDFVGVLVGCWLVVMSFGFVDRWFLRDWSR
jgi:hypothetical protein